MALSNPEAFSEWLAPHSIEWYKQLSNMQGNYSYPWRSEVMEPKGETVFDEETLRLAKDQKVLDAGCGHGEFTVRCGIRAKEIIGFDVTAQFIDKAKEYALPNVSFFIGDSKQDLPFKADEFDFAYNRKGPISAYSELFRVVKKGGNIRGLHPGDKQGEEFPSLFPGLFKEIKGKPIIGKLQHRLHSLPFTEYSIEEAATTEYLATPLDVIKYRCFGQSPEVHNKLIENDLPAIGRIFKANAEKEGLAITFSRYIVRGTI